MARIAVAATAPFGADVLERLAERHEIPYLLTQPDRPSGRGRRVSAPPAKRVAETLGIRVWQPEVGRMVRIVRKHDGPVTALAYARGGTVLLSAGAEGVVRVIDADGDQVLFQWKASDDWIYGLAVSPDGKAVATGDWAGAVRVWDLGEHGARRRW